MTASFFALVAYPNPAEEWLWESGAVCWIIAGIMAFIGIALLVHLWEKWRDR